MVPELSSWADCFESHDVRMTGPMPSRVRTRIGLFSESRTAFVAPEWHASMSRTLWHGIFTNLAASCSKPSVVFCRFLRSKSPKQKRKAPRPARCAGLVTSSSSFFWTP